jgi:hypothetical protein
MLSMLSRLLKTAGRFVRTFAWVAACLAVLFAGLFILPRAIDWEPHKARLAGFLAEATGREVVLGGPLEIALLPQPMLVAQQLRLGNAPGAVTPHLLEARRLMVTLSWSALMQGRIELAQVIVDEPRLVLEPGADGGPNWRLRLPEAWAGQGSTAPSLALTRLEIRNGRVVHATGLSGLPLEAQAIYLSGSLAPGDGVLHLHGTAVVNGVPATLTLDLKTAVTADAPIGLKLGVPGGRLVFAGWPGERTVQDPLRGRVSFDSGFLPEFVQSVTTLTGRRPMRVNEAIARTLAVSADVELADDRLSIDDLDFNLAGERILGSLAVVGGETPLVSGRLVAAHLDADRWLERLQGQALFVAPTGGSAQAATEPSEPSGDDLPSVQVQLTFEVDTVRYRRDTVREVAVTFRYENDVLHLQALKAVLPGDFRLNRKVGFEGDAMHAGYDGVIEVEGTNLRQTLKWIGIDTTSLPPDRLQTLRISGRTRPAKGFVRVTDATFELDDQQGTATADIAYSIPTVITGRLHLPHLNLDAYQLSSAALQGLMPVPDAAPVSPTAGTEPPPPVLDLKATIDRVLYRGETARGVDAHAVIRGNELKLKHVGVGDLLGSHLELSGSIADFGTDPRFDLAYRAVVRDADRMLDYASLPRFVHGRIGPAQVAGRAVGNLKEAVLSDLSVAMLGTTITAAGRLSFEADRRFDFPRFSLASPDIGALVAVASGGARRKLAEVEANGAFRGDAAHATFRGDLEIDGMAISGELSSTLVARPHIKASLRAPAGLRLDRWLPHAPRFGEARAGGSRASASASPEIESLTASLRAFDATLALTMPGLAWGPFTAETVDLAASLRGGVMEVTRLAGTLEGAGLELSATIDARRAVPVMDVRGGIRDIDITRIIAIAGSANEFGADQLAVALEGRLNLENLALRVEGETMEEFIASAVGRGVSNGEVRASVVRGSASFASFATGVASLFSTEMGFTSAVIDGFVGSWIATRGGFEVAGGIVTFDEHTVRAPHATAYVRSRLDLRQRAVDALIALDTGTPGSMDYLMSVRGPLEAPTLRAEPRR